MILHRARPRSIPRIAAFLLPLALVVPGCTPAERPEGVFVYASGADLESGNPLVTVHPLSRQVQRHMLFVTPLRLDERLEPRPYLARDWRWSADQRVLLLSLHPGLAWPDGAPTTARDLAFTYDAIRDPATGSPRAAELAALDAVLAHDDTTLELRFRTPQPAIPRFLAEVPIAPAHLLDTVPHAALKRASFNMAPVGNGPFRFVERRAGERWVFARNDRFPPALGGPPLPSRVVVAVVDEATTKFAGLASGELDVAGISPTMAALARRDPSLRVVEYPVLFTTTLVFNVARPPLGDVRVRRALAMAIDRERLVRVALAGFGTPAGAPAPPENPLALPATPQHDTARADALLDSAGLRRGPDGRRLHRGTPLTLELLTVGSGDNALEQLVQADLGARGIRVEIRQVEMGAFLAAARTVPRRFDLLVTGIPGDLGLAHLVSMFGRASAGGALDYSGYHTAALDAAFARVWNAADQPALGAAWREVQQRLMEEAPVAWLYHSRGVQGMSATLQGVTMDLRGELPTVTRWRRTP